VKEPAKVPYSFPGREITAAANEVTEVTSGTLK
jgi:hypothetical protein